MTFGRVLRNVFSCVWLATSAAVAQPPTMRARTPTCAACRIVLVKDLALDTVNAAATVSRQPIHASRSPQGRIAVVPGSSIEPVLLFDAGGKFLTPIGRKGSGPNEYVRTVAAHWLDADRLNIYDLASARVTTVNAAGRLVGTAPFHANSALLRPLDRGAHLVVNAFGGGRFAVYDSGALDGRTFGTIPEERPTRVQLSNVRRGQFWSVLSRSYRLDAWSVAGRHLATIERAAPWRLEHFHADGVSGVFRCRASVWRDGQEQKLTGEGNGPIAAFVQALQAAGAPRFEIASYKEHSLGAGEGAAAIAYIQIKLADGKLRWGAAVDTNIELASIKAVLSALNRSA